MMPDRDTMRCESIDQMRRHCALGKADAIVVCGNHKPEATARNEQEEAIPGMMSLWITGVTLTRAQTAG
jgi:hypothetical protein